MKSEQLEDKKIRSKYDVYNYEEDIMDFGINLKNEVEEENEELEKFDKLFIWRYIKYKFNILTSKSNKSKFFFGIHSK